MAVKQETSKANIIEFKQHVELELQQKRSKLRATVTEFPCEGESTALSEIFKPSNAHKIVGDMPDTIYNNTKQGRRWNSHEQYGWAERIDPFSSLDSKINPLLYYKQLAVMAMHRKQDEAILEGMLGCNKTGGKGNINEYFPPENIIPAVDGDDFFRTLIGQLITARGIFRKRYVDLDSEQLYVLVPSEVWVSLFALEKATSKDYINTASLQAGKIEVFAGVWFVDIESVPGDDFFPAGTSFPGLVDAEIDMSSGEPSIKKSARFENKDIKYVLPIYCKSAVAFSQRKNIEIKHSEDPSKWHAPQITLTASFGATRIEPRKILGIEISHASLRGVPKIITAEAKEKVAPAKAATTAKETVTK